MRRSNNIYKLDGDVVVEESQKVLEDSKNNKPANFAEKPLSRDLKWMKPPDSSVESSKENNPFSEENKSIGKEIHAKEKINKYRQSIIKLLDEDETEEQDVTDGLETNREISDEEDREDDNILDSTAKSIRSKLEEEEEKDLDLEIDEDILDEPIKIEGKPYFQPTEKFLVEPAHKIIKNIIIERFGVEQTEKGIDFLKLKGDLIYQEENKENLINEFRQE